MDWLWILCAGGILILIDSLVEYVRLSRFIKRMRNHSGGWVKETFRGGKKQS